MIVINDSQMRMSNKSEENCSISQDNDLVFYAIYIVFCMIVYHVDYRGNFQKINQKIFWVFHFSMHEKTVGLTMYELSRYRPSKY